MQFGVILKGQVQGSAHADLSNCCFSVGTYCIVYASNMIMLSKNQSAHSPGSHLLLINLNICKYLLINQPRNKTFGPTINSTLVVLA